MPVAKVNVGRVIPEGGTTGRATDGSQDTSSWSLLTSDLIVSTSDPYSLETSITTVGSEIQFRGTTRVGSNLDNPDDGCKYRFALIDPDSGATVDPADGDIVGIEFYFQMGTNIPNAQNEQFVAGAWDGTTQGMFSGFKYSTSFRLAFGSYTATSQSAFTHSAGYAYQTHIFLADDSSDTSAVAGFPAIYAYDDASTPARVNGGVSGSQTTTIAAGANIALVFAGDVDVTIYYRLVRAPTSPF